MPLTILGGLNKKIQSKNLKLVVEDPILDNTIPNQPEENPIEVKTTPKSRKEYHKQYYQTHKKRCEVCDKEFLMSNYQRHLKTKKHLKMVQENQETVEEEDKEISENIYKELGKKFASSTVRTHRFNIKRVFRECFNDDKHLENNLLEYSKLKNYLESLESPSMRKTLLNSWMRVYEKVFGEDEFHKKYKKLFDNLCKTDSEHRITRKKNQKETENFIEWKTVLEECEGYSSIELNEKSSDKTIMKKLLSQFLLNLPPMRLNEYISTKLGSYDKKKDNYIKDGFWICNDYKTKKIFGTHKVEIPKPLLETIKEVQNLRSTTYLFPAMTQGGAIHENTFRRLLEDILGKSTNFQTLRKVYRSHLEDENTSFEELQRISYLMKHQFSTSVSNYTIYSKRR